jgi:hypothetical protein
MYLHAIGWQMSKKDKIDLDGPKLKEKQGLYTCPALHDNQKPFHTCLEVQEEKIKVSGPCVCLASISGLFANTWWLSYFTIWFQCPWDPQA